MILRRIALREARRGTRWVAPSTRSWRRFMSAEVDSIEASLQNSLKETHSIESVINSHAPRPVAPIDPETHETVPPATTAEDWWEFHRQRDRLSYIGGAPAPQYQPNALVTDPPSPSDVSIELLLASQSHLGHTTSVWNPANARYIFGVRDGIHIISLDATAAHLRRATKVVSKVAERGGLILFVGTRKGQSRCVIKAAELAKGCHLFERWVPGSITNGQQILHRCQMKVVDHFDNEIHGFDPQLAHRPVLKPDLVVCLNPVENKTLLHECALNHIPTIGVIDTDADPTWVTYPVPANDDSLRCVQVVAGVLGRAGEEGQKRRRAAAEAGYITYQPARGLSPPSMDMDANAQTLKEVEDSMFAPEPAKQAIAEEEERVEEAEHNMPRKELA